MKISITCIILFISISCFSQRMAQQNMYIFNTSLINPAVPGMSECYQFDLYGMRQWLGIEHAPSVEGFGIQKGLRTSRSKKHGLGMDFVRDINGPTGSMGGELMYSFHFKAGRSGKNWIGLGVSGLFFSNRIDESGFTPVFDPVINGNIEQQWFYNASAGGIFYGNNYFAGFAVYNLFPTSDEQSGYGFDNYFTTLYAGFNKKKRTSQVEWQSSIYIGKGISIIQTDWNNKFIYENKFFGGLTIRKYWLWGESSGQDALFLLGYQWNRLTFQYIYDIGFNSMISRQSGSHYAGLKYTICRNKYDCPTYK